MDPGQDGLSSHDHTLESFANLGYACSFRVVDPTDDGVPMTRARVHYFGVLKVANPKAEQQVQAASTLWKTIAESFRKEFPQSIPLHCFLYGSWEDPVAAWKCLESYLSIYLSQNLFI